MEHPFLRSHNFGVTLAVHATPGARKTAVLKDSGRNGRLEVKVAAPPDKGRANKAVIEVLAELFGIPRSRISIIRGASSRDKVLLLEGMEMQEAIQACSRL
jgi:uncharacterized protein